MKLLELIVPWLIYLHAAHSNQEKVNQDLKDIPLKKPLKLSSFITHEQLKEAREAALVDIDHLIPGLQSYAGFLTVNKEYESNLWFWYFPVRESRRVENNPWILWLQGGPGVSSLHGLFNEIGPLAMTADKEVKEIKYSWGRNHSLLFIDSPVGTGFSYSTNPLGYSQNETIIGEELYEALQQFLKLFPEQRPCPLTIVGEAYAGKHVLALGTEIVKNGADTFNPVTVHGFAIGNPWLGPDMLPYWHDFLREMGFLDFEVAKQVEFHVEAIMNLVTIDKTAEAYEKYADLVEFIFDKTDLEHKDAAYNYIKDRFRSDSFKNFVVSPKMRKLLHVGDLEFKDYKLVFDKLRPDFMKSVKKSLEDLLERYPVLIYHGHLDLMIPYSASAPFYSTLKYSGAEEYKRSQRLTWIHCGRLAGYYKQGGKLTEMMIRNAGHLVPQDQPSAALALISAFIRNIPFTYDTCPLVPAPKPVIKIKN